MDIATLVGFLGGLGVIIGAIATGGDVLMFVDVPSVLIVVVGTFMVTLMQLSLGEFLGSFKVAMKAFMNKNDNPVELIEKAVELADIARKNGLLALEDQEVDNEFLKRGLTLCVDGHDAAMVNKLLSRDMDLAI
ncbi:MAG: flagellar motor protein PomA, partial [Cycloclasticus sp.]